MHGYRFLLLSTACNQWQDSEDYFVAILLLIPAQDLAVHDFAQIPLAQNEHALQEYVYFKKTHGCVERLKTMLIA